MGILIIYLFIAKYERFFFIYQIMVSQLADANISAMVKKQKKDHSILSPLAPAN
jgi:hypothetical protein